MPKADSGASALASLLDGITAGELIPELALPSPEPSAPEVAPRLAPCSPCCCAPRGGPVFVSPPVQFSLSPDNKALAEAAALLIASKKIQAYWGEDAGD